MYFLKYKVRLFMKGGLFMEINELLNIIANVAFPVSISAYLLVRLEKQIIKGGNKLWNILYL